MPVVDVEDLVIRYGDVVAVDRLSFEIRAGEVYGLLGHNGAGKSSTIETLEGHRSASSGRVAVLGHDPAAAGRALRDEIGIVLQSSGIEPQLSVREAITLYGSVYRRRRSSDELLGLVGLEDKADSRIGTLSGGQRRRVDLALGIVGYPDLLFLDEPTTGFDPAARRESWTLIENLCAEGTTVLLTTHYLDEAEHLADRVGVLRSGRLVAEGTPTELIANAGSTTITFTLPADGPGPTADGLSTTGPVAGAAGPVIHYALATAHPTQDLHRLTTWAVDAGVDLDGLRVTQPTLEDVFLDLDRAAPTTGVGEAERSEA